MTEQILDPGPQLAGAELTPEEQALIDRIDAAPQHKHLVGVALGLSAAFLVYRMYMKRRITEEMKDREPSDLALVAGSVYTAFVPQLVRMFAPQLLQGYLIGVQEARSGDIENDYLMDIAEKYAEDLGAHINDVSMDAAVAGYTRQVNRRVPARRAIQNVISAYGVPHKTMNSLISVWTGEDTKILSSMPVTSPRDRRAASIIDKAISIRGEQIGDTEAWAAKSQAKQLVWMYSMRKGLIPEGSTRIWRTARDERVCPVCGPLHKVEVPIDQPFTTDAGEMWSPPLHPRCRCDIDLAFDLTSAFRVEPVGKAVQGDPYDRDTHGRFSAREQRQRRTEVKESQLQPIIIPDTTIELPDVIPSEPAEPQKKSSLAKPSLGGKHRSLAPKSSLAPKASLSVPQTKPLPRETKSLRRGLGRKPLHAPKRSLSRGQLSSLAPDVPAGGNWVSLPDDAPLFAVIGLNTSPRDAVWHGEEIDATENLAFYSSTNDIRTAVMDYWDVWKDGQLERFNRDEAGTAAYYYKDEDGTQWRIDQQNYEELIDWYASGPEAERRYITLERDDGYTTRDISAAQLVVSTGLGDDMDKAKPNIMVVTKFNANEGEIHDTKGGQWARNPGRWTLIEPDSDSSWMLDELGDLNYEIIYGEPSELMKG